MRMRQKRNAAVIYMDITSHCEHIRLPNSSHIVNICKKNRTEEQKESYKIDKMR